MSPVNSRWRSRAGSDKVEDVARGGKTLGFARNKHRDRAVNALDEARAHMVAAGRAQCRNKAAFLVKAATSFGEARANIDAYASMSTMRERKPLQSEMGKVQDALRKLTEDFKVRCRPGR